VFAPIGRDGAAIAEYLRRAQIETTICATSAEAIVCLRAGVDVSVITEEALAGDGLPTIAAWVAAQPPWSDLPFIVLTSRQDLPSVPAWRQALSTRLRNASLLQRPIPTITLTSTVSAAIRARQRQYEVRDLLAKSADASLELERQVATRTEELKSALDRLRVQMNERAQVEETLRQAQKIEAIGQLTGGVAHDFNNLLMVITGGLQMLERQPDAERRKRLMDGMRQAAQRGAGLTRQLLAFSRRQSLKPEPVDLSARIGGMRELLDRSLRGDIHVALDLPQTLWPVEVDAGELELVILNLAVNARDAMPEGGTIVIRAQNAASSSVLDGDHVILQVVDSGVGMTEEVKARVFEPFFTTKDIGRGSGLGLPQVYGFAKQSGGSIEIQSQVGKGTIVSLFLPRSAGVPELPAEHLVNLHTERRKPAEAGSVLLVEDDAEVANLVTEMLEQLGYQVIRAASASAALGALANERQVDIVFSDIMMPGGMNGVELAKELRSRRADLPVLLTSGYAEAARESAEAAGVEVLPKPYRIEDLAVALQHARTRH
jgi:signal transduction histidine kinase/ActR/RegA family two-component response regulator